MLVIPIVLRGRRDRGPVPDLGQMRPCASYVMRPLTWALNVAYSHSLPTMSGIAPKQNAFKFKITLHKQKQDTPKHNGKSNTAMVVW